MGWTDRLGPLGPPLRLTWAVLSRSLGDGSTHAGNLAYLALSAVFPFFLLVVTVAGALGRTDAGEAAIAAFLQSVPPDVAALLAGPIATFLVARSGGLLTFGLLVALWTASSFAGSLRAIVCRAYGAASGPAWRTRLLSAAGVIATALLILVALTLQVVAAALEATLVRSVPFMAELAGLLRLTRLVPVAVTFLALWALLRVLAPAGWRRRAQHWPGAVLTTLVWAGAATLLPQIIASVSGFHLSYGSLAGVMITLLFFYIVGLGLVMGANLNAELAGAHARPAQGSEGQE